MRERSLRRLVQLLAVLAIGVIAIAFRAPLQRWFTGAPSDGAAANTPEHAAHEPAETPREQPPTAGPALAPVELPPPTLQYVRAALDAYERIRRELAQDEVDELAPRAGELGLALRSAAETLERAAPHGEHAHESPETHPQHGASAAPHAELERALRGAADVADQLASLHELEPARARFAALSERLIAIAAADPRLQQGLHVFTCPMVEGFNQWLQRSPELQNPYMGTRMSTCGAESAWRAPADVAEPETPAAHAHEAGEVDHYTCPMHPSVHQNAPGKCPICGMDLVPVSRADVASGVITVDPGRRQVIGIQTAPVRVAPLVQKVRALGVVAYDETKLVDVTLKLDGFIHDLKVDATGERVAKGDVLFTLYSPELYAAQEEYLLARASSNPSGASLLAAAERRLTLWGLTEAQIAAIAKRGEPIENMPFLSPAAGYVLEKDVVEGASVTAGQRLFRIVPLDTVWVEADVYERDLPLMKVGRPVRVTLPFMPGASFEGRIAYVYPTLDKQTRTGKVRIELPNRKLVLKPEMYADVSFEVNAGEALQVPEAAVIYTGPRALVFVDVGEGRLRPQSVELGREGEEGIEVLAGLSAGDVVVTSGNFLIAAESRIRSATDQWGGGGHGSH